jgi:2-keto-4-pentenoate hydratase/2-oxohepta-3-ene-1,7-dioic acid hydratase in catechol pathway
MKLIRHGEPGREAPGIVAADGSLRDLDGRVEDFDWRSIADGVIERVAGIDPAGLPLLDPDTRLGPPVGDVGKVVCIGLNYSDHAAEAGMPIPDEPVVFMKAPSAISGPCDPVLYPPGGSKLDWEVELAFVIGRTARRVSAERALDHIAGYLLLNDVSERAFQLELGGQWTKGKSYDSFCPIGPWLVTPDEIPEPNALPIWLDVNGRRRQDGNTRTMIFDIAYLVAYLSRFMTLMPGDIVSTGTPPGVGLGVKPEPEFLAIGDEMRLGIEGLGEQCQRVVADERDG